jgi:hypothetical protein
MADPRIVDLEKPKEGSDNLYPTTTYGEGTARRASISDAVFGEITEDGPNYRAVRQTEETSERYTNSRRSAGKERLCLC